MTRAPGGLDCDFLAEGGEMGALLRAHDWAASPLGPPAGWPQGLKTAVRLALTTRHPIFVFWGPEHLCLYNDGYSASLGPEKHPSILGAPGREAWSEIWDIIGPQIDLVMRGEGATWHENQLVPIVRHGGLQEVYWTYSFGPIDDETAPGGVGGVLVVCTETTAQVMAERRAAAERERLASMFSQAPSFMALLQGPEHRFELVNPAYTQVVGHRDVLGRTVAEALPEAAAQGYIELLDQVYRSGEAFNSTGARYGVQVVPGGPVDERFVDFVYQPVIDPGGVVTGIFVEGHDVTERHRASRAARDSEARYRTLFEAIDVGFCIIEMLFADDGTPNDYRFLEINPAFARQSGLTQALGRRVREMVPAHEQLWFDVYGRVALTGEPIQLENGSAALGRWWDVHAFRVGEPEQRRVAALFNDITARRKAELALRELNETLEGRVATALAERQILADIVETTDAQIQALDLNYRWLAINQACAEEYERIFGRRPCVGDSLLELLADRPEQQEAARAVWTRALAGEAYTVVGEFGDPALSRRIYEMKFEVLRDGGGAQVGAFLLGRDITDRLREQRRLTEAEDSLRQAQKMEAVGQLTGGVAHDFNNLLQVIAGGLRLIERPLDPERRRAVLDGMSEAIERGAGLTRQLLTFSRRKALNPEPVELGERVRSLREMLARSLRGDIQIELDIAPGTWIVEVDPLELELMMLNLCLNARDAMPEGGTITISVAPQAGEQVRLVVKDSGVGMTQEVMARAFEPFFTTKEVGQGSGLGLPQVYGFARQSGGDVGIASELGHGTTVTMTLPRSHQATRHTTANRVAASGTPEPARPASGWVLLVEDDAQVAAITGEVLRSMGYRVRTTASAAAALDTLSQNTTVDLVLSDIMMPGGTSGLELARQLRARHPGLPVLLVTGYADAAGSAQAEGFDVLLKPYRADLLAAKLRDLISSPKPPRL